jgi:hypothetical protein
MTTGAFQLSRYRMPEDEQASIIKGYKQNKFRNGL